jgi:hypothetical protein
MGKEADFVRKIQIVILYEPLIEGFKDSLKLSTAILGSVAAVISSFSAHQNSDDKDGPPPRQPDETHAHHG